MQLNGVREGQVHFAFSAARETLRSVEVLLHPAHHAEQMPWIRNARRRLTLRLRSEMAHFRFLFSSGAEIFPKLWRGTRSGTAAAEIDVLGRNVGAYREAVVRRLSGAKLLAANQVRELDKPRWYRRAVREYSERHPDAGPMLDEFVASPAASLERFCGMLLQVQAEIVEPVWGEIHSRLLNDIAMRRALLENHGVTALMRTLSNDLSVRQARDGSATLVFGAADAQVDLSGRCTVTLEPSYFCWPHLQAFVLRTPRGLRVSIAYPVVPLSARTRPLRDRAALARSVAALGNETRLRIVELLGARDLSTRELAGFLDTTEPQVSRHLRMLFHAGLVERDRNGYFVMYRLRRAAFAEAALAIGSFAKR